MNWDKRTQINVSKLFLGRLAACQIIRFLMSPMIYVCQDIYFSNDPNVFYAIDCQWHGFRVTYTPFFLLAILAKIYHFEVFHYP